MMLENDYDLIEAVEEAISGVSYKCLTEFILMGTFKPMVLGAPLIFAAGVQGLDFAQSATLYFLIQSTVISTGALLLKGVCKENAEKLLKKLTNELSSINIFVGYESLLKAYKYDKEYETIKSESAIPRILEKKYIMIPCSDDEVYDEVSLVQEHIVGSKIYTLSVGEPQKTYKLVKSNSTI